MENFKTIHEPHKMVIGVECRTSNALDAAARDIPRLWERFYAEGILNKVPNKSSDDILVLYCDYEGDYTQPYSCVIGCSVTSLDRIPQGLVGKMIPASTFAIFRAVGDFPKSLITTWMTIWQSNLRRTYTGDYEIYKPQFSTAVSKEVDVLIAIEP